MKNGDLPATGFDGPEQCAAGLTKREAFAMHAMQGMLANPEEYSIECLAELLGVYKEDWTPLHWVEFVSMRSVQHADALLAALEESK